MKFLLKTAFDDFFNGFCIASGWIDSDALTIDRYPMNYTDFCHCLFYPSQANSFLDHGRSEQMLYLNLLKTTMSQHSLRLAARIIKLPFELSFDQTKRHRSHP